MMINNGKRMLVMLLAAGMLMSGKNVNKITYAREVFQNIS